MYQNIGDWAPIPIRAVLGGGLVYHGAPKLLTCSGHEDIVSMLRKMDVPQSDIMGWVVGAVELFGGIALLAGAKVRWVSALVAGQAAISILSGVRRGGFPRPLPGGQPLPGYEASFFYTACSLALTISGAGRLSVDRLRGKR